MKNTTRFLIPAIIGALLWSAGTRAADLERCRDIARQIAERKSRQEALKVVIDRNNQLLAADPHASASTKIKVRSNLLVTNLQIETLSNEITDLMNSAEYRGCPK